MALADTIHVGALACLCSWTLTVIPRLSNPRQLVLGLGQDSGHTPAPLIMLRKGAISPVTTPEATCRRTIAAHGYQRSLNPNHRPVYEYPLNGQWIMMDIDDGYILWTGIWKGEGWKLVTLHPPLILAFSTTKLLVILKVCFRHRSYLGTPTDLCPGASGYCQND